MGARRRVLQRKQLVRMDATELPDRSVFEVLLGVALHPSPAFSLADPENLDALSHCAEPLLHLLHRDRPLACSL